ncbi:MAG: hypothetical protein ABRQ26_07130 [Syntrophomonadaceae bacterium]
MHDTVPASFPLFSNSMVIFWSLLNVLLLLGILLFIFWYIKQVFVFRKQVLNKLDILISLQDNKHTDNK